LGTLNKRKWTHIQAISSKNFSGGFQWGTLDFLAGPKVAQLLHNYDIV